MEEKKYNAEVALELMRLIATNEPNNKQRQDNPRDYYLNLYKACKNVAYCRRL